MRVFGNMPEFPFVDSDLYAATLTEQEANEIDYWVRSSKSGRRIAWDQWKMKNEKAVAWFVLKWGS